MWELDNKKCWALKNWCLWTMALEKTLEGPLDFKEIQADHPKGDQPGCSLEGLTLKVNSNTLATYAESWLIWKYPDAGKDWGQEQKGMTEDEMVGWHHLHNGHGFGWTPGAGDGLGDLACCGSWDCKESDTTEPLNWLNVDPISWLTPIQILS